MPPICTSQLDQAPPPGGLDDLSPLRRAVVEAAASQIGVVADASGTDCNKQGWQSLADFYAVSLNHDLIPYHLNLVKTVGKKVSEWCGIFALWAVKKGAQNIADPEAIDSEGPPPSPAHGQADYRGPFMKWVHWKYGRGIQGIPVRFGNRGIQPGDVVVFRGDLSHHAVVERVIGDQIHTIDGNVYCQMIARKVRDLSEVVAYYPIEQ